MSMAKISQSHIRSWTVLLPPIAKKTEIVEMVGRALQKVESSLDRSKRLVELLKERRTALITAAITGQIDVSNYASATEPAAA